MKEAGGSAEIWDRDPSPVRPYSITREARQHRECKFESSISYSVEPKPTKPTSPQPIPTEATSTAPTITESIHLRISSCQKSRSESSTSTTKPIPGLQFFNFTGDSNGEDLKLEFKKRITEAEVLLTEGEKCDIINEANHIFKFMVAMIGELDSVMGTCECDAETAKVSRSARDSVLVSKERLLRMKEGERRKTSSAGRVISRLWLRILLLSW